MSQIYPSARHRNVYKKIILNNVKRDWSLLSDHAELNSEGKRRRPEPVPDRENIRPAFFHDTDRIIHCQGYSRYIDKTQVFFQAKSDHVTRRVLHVQLVSKIARTLARFFRANEDLVEAIALAHDIGHAPFGHAGEEYIAEFLEENDAGSFVHNAQSVRLLDSLEDGGRGLNLTLQVLDGVLGHNGEFWHQEISFDPANLKWDKLDANVAQCFAEPRKDKPEKKVYPSTIEGCIVRVSDVIAYLGRDIEDAISVGLIGREALPGNAISLIGASNREIINNLAMDLVHNSPAGNVLRFSSEVFDAMQTLLKFNYEEIYGAAIIKKQKERFRRLIRDLFELYLDDICKGHEDSPVFRFHLAQASESYRSETSPYRVVADFLAGMTDRFLVAQYKDSFLPEKIDYTLFT
jgi:dGTPase